MDHYETLGVAEDATPADIKRAYNRLARELHPDHNPSEEAAERFKLVNHAYDVLGSPDKRAEYDRERQYGGMGGFGMADLFTTLFGGGARRRGPASRKQRGQDSLLRLHLTLDEVIFGTHKEIKVQTAVLCETCKGSCLAPGAREERCRVCEGAGHIERRVHSPLGEMVTSQECPGCHGFGTTLSNPCPACAGHGRVRAERIVPVDVPGGVETGLRIQLPGEGEVGEGGGPAGDLHLEINVQHHDVFSRAGDDLLAVVEVGLADALLGASVRLDALDGPVDVEVPAGVQSGDVITVPDRGVTRLRGSGRGDLRLAVQLVTPTKLDSRSRKLAEELQGRLKQPAPQFAAFQQGLFARIRDRFLR